MMIATSTGIQRTETKPSKVFLRQKNQQDRIAVVFGGTIPSVDEDSLYRYYQFLANQLSMPFLAYYPHGTGAQEETKEGYTVLELLNPRILLGDLFDGIFCKTRDGQYEVNLPLVELELSPDSLDYQLVEDYWYWFWNWRS